MSATELIAPRLLADPRSRRAEIRPLTSLRGLAAIWVVFSHLTVGLSDHWSGPLWNALRAGYMGVDVFFVLSGFVLAMVYLRLDVAGIPRFLFRRIIRVYPLNIVTLGVYAVLAATIMPIGPWANWHLLPVFMLMLQAYLPEFAAAWNPATWSVGVELLCYLLFPLGVALIRRLPTASLAVIGAISVAGIWWAQQHVLGWALGWRAVVRGLSAFWPGMVLCVLALRLPRPAARWLSAGEIFCAGGIVLAVGSGVPELVPVFSAGLVLALYFDAGVVAWLLRRQPFFWLGEISFSVYLLHALLIGRLLPYATVLSWHMSWDWAVPLFLAGFFALVFALSHVTYRLIECPARRLDRLWPV
jgi:peptidoglycan/LPS O-acetylase OafA/YrhL